jgi:hypothetical protein
MKGRVLLAALLATAAVAHAQKQTVCTVTVNSADERDVFRDYLPAERYDFVELVQDGRRDWLEASCRKGVRCDVLLVSGHFAGTEFYSSRFDRTETLPVAEIERAQCSGSCEVFSQLKEVYLFGCDTLNPTPVRTVTPEVVRSLEREGAEEPRSTARALAERHGESALDHMRRLFPDVPVIYGFSSKAPYGRVAGPMLRRYFQASDPMVGSGQVSEPLRKLFAPASMTVTAGLRATEANADYRAEACRYRDDRLTPAAKLANIRATMARSMAETRLTLDRIEKFFSELSSTAKADPAFAVELASLSADTDLRRRYLTLAHDTPDPAVRVRMIALGGEIGWLDAAGRRAEIIRMVADVLNSGSASYGEVDLICSLNADRSLDGERARISSVPASRTSDAALACLGDDGGRARTLRALASRDEGEVQVVQAYLRHRPITDAEELRAVALKVASMEPVAAQVRALDTLARHRIADPAVLEALERLSARTASAAVKRAVEEVFLRSGR